MKLEAGIFLFDVVARSRECFDHRRRVSTILGADDVILRFYCLTYFIIDDSYDDTM